MSANITVITILTALNIAIQPMTIPEPMHATAYCLDGITASGEYVRDGICATGDKSHIGEVAVLYQRLPDGTRGDYIGTYDVRDCGCHENVIDVWCANLEECKQFMNRVYENGAKGKIYVYFEEKEK